MVSPVDGLAWAGRCGENILMRIPRLVQAAGRGSIVFAHDLGHGTMRVLRPAGDWSRSAVQAHSAAAEAVRREFVRKKHGSFFGWTRSVVRMLGMLIFHEEGVLYPLLRYLVPLTCCGALFAVVSYHTARDHSIAVTLNGEALGLVAEEQEYTAAEEIVRRRLSYADAGEVMQFGRSLELVPYDGYSPLLTASELADRMLRSQNISLCEGSGVYVGDEFMGAVQDAHAVEEALRRNLSAYAGQLGEDAEDVRYAEDVTYEKGIFLAENLVDANAMIRRLTEKKESLRTYTASASENIYTVAERFSVTPEEIRALNPELDKKSDVIPHAMRLQVPVTERFLPIVFTRTTVSYTSVPYDSREYETAELAAGTRRIMRRGQNGEKQNTVRITYKDGMETGRKILKTLLVSPPVDEETGIGTFSAQPYSKETVIKGDGRYLWPVDGGGITDVFGGTRNHRGIDIGAAEYSNIFAGMAGTVIVSGWNDSYGNFIILDHHDGYETLYAHCVALLAQVGDEVHTGQVIALVGTTGHSTGPHLHFEVRYQGTNYNPMMYLRVNAD